MKITPLEIRQKTFEKGFRGYEKEEVNAYLNSLSSEWEKLMDENRENQIRVENLEKEVAKLREVESSLYKTLKTAEDTGANMIDQANKMADIHMKETEVRAEAILNDAKNKAHDTIEEAEMIARQTIEDMEDQLKNLMHVYKNLENMKDDMISDLKGIATEILEKSDRFKSQTEKADIESFFMQARRESKQVIEDRLSTNSRVKREQIKVRTEKAEVKNMEAPKPEKVKNDNTETNKKENQSPSTENDSQKKNTGEDRSFFDEIE